MADSTTAVFAVVEELKKERNPLLIPSSPKKMHLSAPTIPWSHLTI
jgi:hypothetical protein